MIMKPPAKDGNNFLRIFTESLFMMQALQAFIMRTCQHWNAGRCHFSKISKKRAYSIIIFFVGI
jgi:hypothetical protein